MALSPVFMELRASIGEFKAKMNEAEREIGHLSRKGGGSFQKLAAIGKGALLGLGAAGIGIGVAAVHLADTYEKSHAQMENAIKRTGASLESFKGPIASTDATLEHLGFTNAQTEEALAKLTTGTGSARKAIADVGLAANIARARNIDLASAAALVTKAAAGQARGLKAFGIAGVDAITKIKDPAVRAAAIMEVLRHRFAGAAAAAAGTFAGKMDALHAKVSDLGKNLGMKLIPVIMRVVDVTMAAVNWFGKHRAVAIALAAVIGGALAITLAAAVVEFFSAAAGVVALGVAFVVGLIPGIVLFIAMFWPVIAAVAALIAVGYLLYRNWRTIWDGIRAVMRVAWAIIRPIGEAFLLIFFAPIIVAIKLLSDHWRGLWTGLQAVLHGAWAVIRPIFELIKLELRALATVFLTIGHGIARAWSAVWDVIGGTVKAVVNTIIRGINVLIRGLDAFHFSFHLPSFLGGFGFDFKGLGIPQIPTFERGGIVPGTGPILSIVHGGERIVPRAQTLAGAGGGGSPVTIEVPVYLEGRQVARAVLPFMQSELIRQRKRSGTNGIE